MGFFDNTKILANLSDSEKKNLEVFCQEKSLKAGEILFKEGDEANAMYLLQEGELVAYKNISGKDVVLGGIFAEDLVGEMAIFGEKGKRMASVKAVKDSVLIVLLDFSIKELTQKNPEILEKIKEIIEIRNIANKSKN